MEALANGDLAGTTGKGALNHEDMLLPIVPPGYVPGMAPLTWVEAVIVALLQKGIELGMTTGDWPAAVPVLIDIRVLETNFPLLPFLIPPVLHVNLLFLV